MGQAHHQRDHHADHQHQVYVGQLRAFVRCVFKNGLDVAITTAALKLCIADPLAFGATQQKCGEYHPGGAADHGR
ncbi:hypothetical protein D3C85_1817910 [compost metagenome]